MRIIHPRPELGRQTMFDVDFIDGVANVDSLHPERELAFRQHGFAIEADLGVEAPFQEDLGEPIVDLAALTKTQLRDMLPEDADISARASKADLIDAVSRQPAEPIPGSIEIGQGVFIGTATDNIAPGGLVLGDVAAFAEPDAVGEAYVPTSDEISARNAAIVADMAAEPPASES
jgi:hypothetical protein